MDRGQGSGAVQEDGESLVVCFGAKGTWTENVGNCEIGAKRTWIRNLEVGAGANRTPISGSLNFFLFEQDFESLKHNKMIMMFMKVKEFALQFHVESMDRELSRRVEERASYGCFFRSWRDSNWNLWNQSYFFKILGVEAGVRGTYLKIMGSEPELQGLESKILGRDKSGKVLEMENPYWRLNWQIWYYF